MIQSRKKGYPVSVPRQLSYSVPVHSAILIRGVDTKTNTPDIGISQRASFGSCFDGSACGSYSQKKGRFPHLLKTQNR